MKIGIMLRHYEQKEGGVKLYTKRLLPLLFSMGSKHRYVLIYRNPELVGTYAEYPNVEEVAVRLPGSAIWDQIAVPWVARRRKLDLVFNPKFTVPVFTRAKKVFVLHGSEWFAIPDHFLWYDRLYFRRALPFYCRRADALIAVSNATRRDVIEHVGVPGEKIRAIHNGFDPNLFRVLDDRARLDSVKRKYALPARFIMWVGQIESRKNIGRLLRAFARIAADVPHQLVIVGEQRFSFPMAAGAAADLRLIAELELEERVHFTGWIAHDELPAVYNLAELFAFPSLHEGFGIPLLEAMACACPTVTAKTCAPPEVAEGAAYLVDPLDVDAIAEGMRTVLCDATLRERMIAKGLKRAADFSWEKCAGEVLTLFDSLTERAPEAELPMGDVSDSRS